MILFDAVNCASRLMIPWLIASGSLQRNDRAHTDDPDAALVGLVGRIDQQLKIRQQREIFRQLKLVRRLDDDLIIRSGRLVGRLRPAQAHRPDLVRPNLVFDTAAQRGFGRDARALARMAGLNIGRKNKDKYK